MAKRIDSRALGLFVLGGIALLVGAIVLFAGTNLLQTRPRAVVVFKDSVAGLSVGAPVTLRGVRVGTVTDINLEVDARTGVAWIPVYLEFDPEKARVEGDGTSRSLSERMVERGLRATLALQSIVTGQLLVELNYYPGSPATVSGRQTAVPEIPTAPSEIERVKKAIAEIPLQELAESALRTLNGLNEVIRSPELRQIVTETARAATAMSQVASDFQSNIAPISSNIRDASAAAQATFERAAEFVAAIEPPLVETSTRLARASAAAETSLGAITQDARGTLQAANTAISNANRGIAAFNDLVSPRSPAVQDLDATMRNLAAATESLRSFAQRIDRNPNAVLFGDRRR